MGFGFALFSAIIIIVIRGAVVEKSIGACKGRSRKKLICRVITPLIQSVEMQSC